MMAMQWATRRQMDNVFRATEGRFTNLMEELGQEGTMISSLLVEDFPNDSQTAISCKMLKKR